MCAPAFDWPGELASIEAAIAGEEPPFAAGQLVVSRTNPLDVRAVESCEPHPRGGFTARFTDGCGPADAYAAAPDGWVDAPAIAPSELSLLIFRSAGIFSEAQRAHAIALDAARLPEWLAELHALADWYERHVAEIDPEIAARNAEGLREAAVMLAEEAGGVGFVRSAAA